MASPLEEIKIALKVTDANASSVVKKLESSFRGLANASKQLDAQGISKVRDGILRLNATGKSNINTIQSQVNALRALRNEAEIGSSQFKQLTADIAKYDQQLQKAQGTKKRGGRLASAAKSVGAIAGAGVFGGPEGALGATIGAFAGPQGAIIGGAIGAQVGQFRQALGATADYAANIEKLRIALKGVTTSQEEYQASLKFIEEASRRFAIPQDIVTKNFTRLQASVQGAGGSIEDTKTAFNGIVSSVRATGGSLEDVRSALVATSQVFSKGKVSAEELRQQIGERLPGAFTLFAASIGKTPQELDKALERGEVSLQDFQTFSEAIFKKYGLTAEIIAKSPEAAGDRLQVALSNMNEAVGRLLTPIGAAFQNTFTAILNAITDAADALDRFLGTSDQARLNILNEKITQGNLRLAELNADIRREQQARPGADLLGGAAAAGGGADALIFERDQLARQIGQMSTEQKSLLAMRNLKNDIEQARPGTGLPGIDPNDPSSKGTGTSKKAPVSQMVVDLQQKLADNAARITEREQLGVQFAIKRLQILQGTLTGTDKEFALAKNLFEYRQRSAALDEKEASVKEKGLATLTQFEQLEANLLAKKEGFTGEQTKQQLLQATINSLTQRFQQGMIDAGLSIPEVTRRIKEAAEATVDLKDNSQTFAQQFADGIKGMADLTGNLADVAVSAFKSMGDMLAEFVITGKANFAEFTRSLLADLSRIFIKMAMVQAISVISPGLGKLLGFRKGGVVKGMTPPTTMPDSVSLVAANGMAFGKNKIVPYAKGGIVNKPTLFQYASGGAGRFGLMGEAGPEAIMPLRRGANGKLGVESSGTGMGNITVNVDASGSSVEGDASEAAQLGKMLGAAVQAELVKQKRPGGLLAS